MPVMPVPLDQFVKQLEESGVLASDTLQEFLPPKSDPEDREDRARDVVLQKRLVRRRDSEVCSANCRDRKRSVEQIEPWPASPLAPG